MSIDEGRSEFVRIDHVQLAAPVGSEAMARRFFVTILGMRELRKPENLENRGGIWFQTGSNQLHVGVEGSEEFPSKQESSPSL